MHCIFITGKSGTGKTTYAKEYATKKGYHTYISPAVRIPLITTTEKNVSSLMIPGVPRGA